MHIFFVAERYPPFIGGVETQLQMVAHALAQTHRVEVAAMHFAPYRGHPRLELLHESLFAPSYADFDDDGVPVHAVTPTPAERLRLLPVAVRAVPRVQRYLYHELRAFGYAFYRRVYVPKLRRLMEGADVVHSVAGGYLGWAAQEAAHDLGIPFVCTPYVHPGQHGDDPRSVAFYRASDAVFALLETDRAFLRDLGVEEDRLHLAGVVPLLPDAVHPDRFRAAHGLGGAPVVLFVGRIVAYKGVPALLAAAERVWARHPDARFLFAGMATEREAAWFDDVDPRIVFLGRVSEQEKADALAACDVFCMPSAYEILPAVYLEAWSYGKPVVGGPAHGLDVLIEGNGAGVVAGQSGESVAEALLGLLDDPDRRAELGAAGRALVEDRFSRDGLVRRLLAVYRRVAGAP